MYRFLRVALGVLLVVTVCRARVLAATLPSDFSEALVASGLANPTAMAFAPDGRLFVCLQGGQVRVIENGTLLAAPFVTLTVNSEGERGLLGLAFDPNFGTNHYVYIYYTATTPTVHNRVSRFVANGNVALAGSEVAILDLDNLSGATNHNGGAMHFGLDGKLYIGVGENANPNNSQSFNNLLGKLLRINADGTIPGNNPFLAQTMGKNQAIWALGLRNPYTFAFHPFSGRMLINDVGQSGYEEINDGFAGANYGWPNSEGPTSNPNETGPIYFYPHNGGTVAGCAITGGTFYSPDTMQFPSSFLGTYFFADFCSGWIKILNPANNNAVSGFATGIASPVDLQVGPNGNLYYLARGAGSIYRIFYTGNQAPQITLQPVSQTVAAGEPVTFRVDASGSPLPSFRWQRNGVDIPGATSATYSISSTSANDNGARFRAIATNQLGSATSAEAILTVTASRVNVAAATNGATAVASSTFSSAFAPTGAINGDRKGIGWGNGGGWNDGTGGTYPDSLEIDFAGSKTIDEIDVFTLQDNYQSPIEPTLATPFSQYGITDFQVQYWTGAAWAMVPNGSITGSRLVWRRLSFAPLSTTRIRILVTGSLNTWSRITEVEAYQSSGSNISPTATMTSPSDGTVVAAGSTVGLAANASDSDGTIKYVDFFANGNPLGRASTSPYTFSWTNVQPGTYTLTAVATDNLDAIGTSSGVVLTVTAGGLINVAAAANGATAVASSTHSSSYAAAGAINGDHKGLGWGNGGGWNDATPDAFPDWLEIDFAGAKTIQEVDVFTVQDNYQAPIEPTATTAFNFYGITDFQVQYWTGQAWAAVPGGIVSGNRLVWTRIAFAPLNTTRIRILVTGAMRSWSRIVEVEAY